MQTKENPLPKVAEQTPKVEKIQKRASIRAKRVSLQLKGKQQPGFLDDEVLLDDVTRAAHDAVGCQTTLSDAIKACAQQDIDRDDVIKAVIAGGYAESTARSMVSIVYGQVKGRVNRKGQGRETPMEAIQLASRLLKEEANSFKRAKGIALAAYRHLKVLEHEAGRKQATSVRTTADAVKTAEVKTPAKTPATPASPTLTLVEKAA